MSEQAEQLKDTILPHEFNGSLLLLTGLRGSGKSTLASTSELPENILYLDFESKNLSIHKQLGFGEYHSVTDEVADKYGADYTHDQMFVYMDALLKGIQKDKFTVCIIDNVEPFQNALLARVKKIPVAYGVDPVNAASGRFGGAWSGVATLMSGHFSLLHSKGVRLIIVICHLKAVWSSAGPVPNKFQPVGIARLHELSSLSLVMFYAESSPIPSALVQKEMMGKLSFNRETRKHEIQRRLPLRLPEATFDAIREYLDHPADLRNPKVGEVPTEEEAAPFNDKFSKDQLNFMAEMARAAGHEGGVEIPKVEPRAVTASNKLTAPAAPSVGGGAAK